MNNWLSKKKDKPPKVVSTDSCALKRSNPDVIDIADCTPAKRACPDHAPCENRAYDAAEIERPDSPSGSESSIKSLPQTPKSDQSLTSLKSEGPQTPANALNRLKRDSATPNSSSKKSELERKMKQIEREKIKVEKQLQKQQKEDEKQRLKEKRELERKQKEAEKLQKKELKDAENEEKKRQREEKEALAKAEKEKKEKEKAAKEAERQAESERKFAERKAKEEEREKIKQKEKLEEDKKKAALLLKQKAAEKSKNMMQNWLVIKPAGNTPAKSVKTLGDSLEDTLGWLVKPFQLKEGMVVAPMVRKKCLNNDERKSLSSDILQGDTPSDMLYLCQLRRGEIKPSQAPPTLLPKSDDNDIICDEPNNSNEQIQKYKNKMEWSIHKAKLIQHAYKSRDSDGEYEKCNRPPYFGTWRKKSKVINGRRPFRKDVDVLDYALDSDAEWEEEPPDAEDCQSDEDDDAKEDEDEDNDGFFVDHGYLSEGEGMSDEEGECDDPEARRGRMTARAEAWKAEKLGKNRWKRLVPIIVGPCLPGVDHNHSLCTKLAELKIMRDPKLVGPVSTSFTAARLKCKR